MAHVEIDLSQVDMTGEDKRKDCRLVFATLLRASAQIMAQSVCEPKENGDMVFIAKSYKFGAKGNPCEGNYEKDSTADRLIASFIDEGWADGYNLNSFIQGLKYAPVMGPIMIYSKWKRRLDQGSCKNGETF